MKEKNDEFGGAHPYCDFAFEHAKSWRIMALHALTHEEIQDCMTGSAIEALQLVRSLSRLGLVAWAQPCEGEL